MSDEERRGMSPEYHLRSGHQSFEEALLESFHHLTRSTMALADAMNAMTTAVGDAVAEIRSLATTIANSGDVEAATTQLNTLAENLEQAVSDAQTPAGQTPPDTTTPPDETPVTPPTDTPPADSSPV